MTLENLEVQSLRENAQAIEQEAVLAVMFHETWRPAAYDAELRERMSNSYAAHTFNIIRLSLRREMLMALARLWDADNRTPSISALNSKLRNRSLFSRLCAYRAEHLRSTTVSLTPETFFTRYPKITLQLDVAGTNEVIRRVIDDEADIGLVWNPPPEPKIASRTIKRQPLKVITAPGFPLEVTNGVVKAEEIFKHPLAVSHHAYGTRQMLDALAHGEGIRFNPVVTTNTSAVVKQFVKSGLGIACLPEFAVSKRDCSGRASLR